SSCFCRGFSKATRTTWRETFARKPRRSCVRRKSADGRMRIVRLEGVDDPRFADRDLYRVIGDHRELRAHGLFVAEGRLVVERLLELRRPVRSLLVNESALRALEPACANLGGDVTAFVCHTDEFERLTGYDIHRGCLALAPRPLPLTLDALV